MDSKEAGEQGTREPDKGTMEIQTNTEASDVMPTDEQKVTNSVSETSTKSSSNEEECLGTVADATPVDEISENAKSTTEQKPVEVDIGSVDVNVQSNEPNVATDSESLNDKSEESAIDIDEIFNSIGDMSSEDVSEVEPKTSDATAPITVAEEKSTTEAPALADVQPTTECGESASDVNGSNENDDVVMLPERTPIDSNETFELEEKAEDVSKTTEEVDSKTAEVQKQDANIEQMTEAANDDEPIVVSPQVFDLLNENEDLFCGIDETVMTDDDSKVDAISEDTQTFATTKTDEEAKFELESKTDESSLLTEISSKIDELIGVESKTDTEKTELESKTEESGLITEISNKIDELMRVESKTDTEKEFETELESKTEESALITEISNKIDELMGVESKTDTEKEIESESTDANEIPMEHLNESMKTAETNTIMDVQSDVDIAMEVDVQSETKADTEPANEIPLEMGSEATVEANTETTMTEIESEGTEAANSPAKTSPTRRECLNTNCEKKSDIFHDAPEFVINHYHLNKRKKVQFVCDDCYDRVTQNYGELCAALEDKQPLFLKKIKYSDLVEIIDSSDEEDETDSKENCEENGCFDKDTLALIENELEAVIAEQLNKVDIKQQMDWNRQILSAQIDQNEINCKEMVNEMKALAKKIDKLYTDTYNFRHTFIEEAPSLDLQTGKPVQICTNSYPPKGTIEFPEIAYNTLYYTFRKKLIARWHPCKVIEKSETDGNCEYVIKFCRQNADFPNGKKVFRKHLAYGRAPDTRLAVGTRVIAACNSNGSKQLGKKDDGGARVNFYPGIIAEPLSTYTLFRYLVFFDDGNLQYVHPESVRLVCEAPEKVWDFIEEPGAKAFIEGYLKNCAKKQALIQVRRGQRIQTELNGKWYQAIVNNVDCTLVQMYFEEQKQYDWIYRGSSRFHSLYRRLNHASANRNDAPFEYITIDDNKEPERSNEPPVEELPQPKTPPSKTSAVQRTFASQAARDTPQQKQREQKRAVAKKSTGSQPKPAIQHMNNSTIYVDEDKPKGKVIYYTAKKHILVKKYVQHECNEDCLIPIKHNLSTYSPLSKPLLSGFERPIAKLRGKKFVMYTAPCGRQLRDMHEMHKYLRMTNCKLNVENFTFDPLVHCLAEYVIDEGSYVMKKADLSAGVEKMPIQLVNCYDNTVPPPCTYSAKRIPTEGVNLNCDDEFLCGCDCEDDCLDKSKCSCWKLTLQGARYGNPDTPIEDVGYEYKRLNEPVPTGIYECNSRCKCNATCVNRVVQHQITLKLQVFKTVNRGWGIRCLNDVPKGTFICCYAGNLLTETAANEAGGELGDEYFAELDYIEVVENMKEGYEPEVVPEDDQDSSGTDEDFDVERESMRTRNNDSDDEFVAKSYTASEDSESRRYRTRNSVDTRKKPEPTPKEVDTRKNRHSSSDDDGDEVRQVRNFMASNSMSLDDDPDDDRGRSIRKWFGRNEAVYIMDAKKAGNIGRYFNHSCGPNLFVQNVFVDTHDLRFPWVAFFASTHIRAGTELAWNYNYEVGSVPGKVLICQCGDDKCRGRIL